MKKILIAEDDKFLAKAYNVKFTKAGFEVLSVYDGNEALKGISTFGPDLVLLDLMMPEKDGFGVLEELKKQNNPKKIPIIITSNLSQKEDKDRCFQLGASDYVVKSDISLDELIKKVNSLTP